MTQDKSQELSGEGRRRLLVETLNELDSSPDRARQPDQADAPNDPAGVGDLACAQPAWSQARRRPSGSNSTSSKKTSARQTSTKLKSIPKATRPPLSDLINTWCPVQKIFVAVHGIGDQFQSETVQTVAYRVCDYVGVPAALPLGRFHGPGGTVTKAFIPDPDRDPPIHCGFAEIYWANVPRIPAADKHILEEPKKWAQDPGRAAPAARCAATAAAGVHQAHGAPGTTTSDSSSSSRS